MAAAPGGALTFSNLQAYVKQRGRRSLEFTALIKTIGECKSKTDEDAIVQAEISLLKQRLIDPKLDKDRMREYIIRLIYVEMLGHNANFGHIHAVKMTHEANLLNKKVGYLATTLFLHENHELNILIVNTLQQDLKSDNALIVCTALTAVTKLINADNISAMLTLVVDLLSHPMDIVRKKAVVSLHRFFQQSPAAVSHLLPRFRQMLCDKDPSVMAASLHAIQELATMDAQPFRNLIPSLLNILKQVIDHKLPKAYDYPRSARALPAPFIQIRLLKILAVLGAGEKAGSESMYGILAEVLQKGDNGTTIGHAIVYECVKTITAIFPNQQLIEVAADLVARFLRSKSHNLRYVGIDALGSVVRVNPKYVAEHQLAVIDCLEDPDESLKKKTLDLLFKMTKPFNVDVIVTRLLDYVRTSSDAVIKGETVGRIAELAERYAPSNAWFIRTMDTLFELEGDLMKPAQAHNLMRLIAEGGGEDDEEAESELRASACASYIELLRKPKLNALLLQVIFWVLGEYGATSGGIDPAQLIVEIVSAVETQPAAMASHEVQGYAITALAKVVVHTGCPLGPAAESFAQRLSRSRSTDLQQRSAELRALAALDRGLAVQAIPPDASCEDIEVDPELGFLNDFVAQALANGASPYLPPEARTTLANPLSKQAQAAAEAQAAAIAAASGPISDVPIRDFVPSVPLNAQPLPSEAGMDIFGFAQVPATGRPAPPQPPALFQHHVAEDEVRLKVEGPRRWGPNIGFGAPEPPPPPPAAAAAAQQQHGDAMGLFGDGMTVASGGQQQQQQQRAGVGGGGGHPGHQHPPAKPKKVEPPVDPEKARLAAALFGGAGPSSAPARTPAARTPHAAPAARTPAQPVSAAQPRPQRTAVDLLSDLSVSTPSAGGAGPIDPFAMLESMSTPAATAMPRAGAPAAAAAPAHGDRGIDLLSAGGGSVNLLDDGPRISAAPIDLLGDAFGGPPAVMAAQQQHQQLMQRAPQQAQQQYQAGGGAANGRAPGQPQSQQQQQQAQQSMPAPMAELHAAFSGMQPKTPTALGGQGVARGANNVPADPFHNLLG